MPNPKKCISRSKTSISSNLNTMKKKPILYEIKKESDSSLGRHSNTKIESKSQIEEVKKICSDIPLEGYLDNLINKDTKIESKSQVEEVKETYQNILSELEDILKTPEKIVKSQLENKLEEDLNEIKEISPTKEEDINILTSEYLEESDLENIKTIPISSTEIVEYFYCNKGQKLYNIIISRLKLNDMLEELPILYLKEGFLFSIILKKILKEIYLNNGGIFISYPEFNVKFSEYETKLGISKILFDLNGTYYFIILEIVKNEINNLIRIGNIILISTDVLFAI